MNGFAVIFAPLLPWAILVVLALAALLVLAFAIWRRLAGWFLRGLALSVLALAIANPSVQFENREALSDIVVLLVDETASQNVGKRPAQTDAAIAKVQNEIAKIPNTELRIVPLGDSDGNRGTLLMEGLAKALAEEPRARIAGAILLTDGRLHDVEAAPELPAPLHVLLTGQPQDWDRRLIVQKAPGFAVIGEEIKLTIRIEDQGKVPGDLPEQAEIDVALDGGDPIRFQAPIGVDLELPLTLEHGGMNVVQFFLPEQPGELTTRNNAAVVQINGVRDRLRVLLVSGEPHAGERTWRNLLKSDASVDLVHFTILRPPEKQDGVPVDELSLIAFPTRELFLDKVDEFDLIIFDRYKRRGLLPSIYLDNVRQYVVEGGALLVAAGPDFASADSIYRSPLAEVLPGVPTGRVRDEFFLPGVTDIGARHPVTEGLYLGDTPQWGRWMRQIDVEEQSGATVMTGLDGQPLLLLDRVGEGRVALLASDHAWLWSRGFEGGGPQLELLRRLGHWMMKEPGLEEEAILVTADGLTMDIVRRTLGENVGDLEITGPDGAVVTLPLKQETPGRYVAQFEGKEMGLYRLREGAVETVFALGPAAPREFEETIASGEILQPIVNAAGGSEFALSDGVPNIRRVRSGRQAHGRGWLGITPREAYLTADLRVSSLLPAWAMLILAALFAVSAWLWEGRR